MQIHAETCDTCKNMHTVVKDAENAVHMQIHGKHAKHAQKHPDPCNTCINMQTSRNMYNMQTVQHVKNAIHAEPFRFMHHHAK